MLVIAESAHRCIRTVRIPLPLPSQASRCRSLSCACTCACDCGWCVPACPPLPGCAFASQVCVDESSRSQPHPAHALCRVCPPPAGAVGAAPGCRAPRRPLRTICQERGERRCGRCRNAAIPLPCIFSPLLTPTSSPLLGHRSEPQQGNAMPSLRPCGRKGPENSPLVSIQRPRRSVSSPLCPLPPPASRSPCCPGWVTATEL